MFKVEGKLREEAFDEEEEEIYVKYALGSYV